MAAALGGQRWQWPTKIVEAEEKNNQQSKATKCSKEDSRSVALATSEQRQCGNGNGNAVGNGNAAIATWQW